MFIVEYATNLFYQENTLPKEFSGEVSVISLPVTKKTQAVAAVNLPKAAEVLVHDPTADVFPPGSVGIVTVPLDILHFGKLALKAIQKNDFKSLFALTLPAIQIPLYSIYAGAVVIQTISTALNLLFSLRCLDLVTLPLAFVGVLLCAIEFVMQAKWVYNIQQFQKLVSTDNTLQNLQNIQERYFPQTVETEKAYEELIQMVKPRLAQKLYDELSTAIQEAKNGCTERGESLIQEIKTQCHKRYLIQALAITSIIFSLIGVVLLPFTSGTALVAAFAIATLIFTLWVVKHSLHKTILNSEGWSFNPSGFLPKCLQAAINTATKV